MKLAKQLILAIALLGATSASATVTISFNGAFFNGVVSNLSNSAGVAGINGMRWGIIVSTSDSDFAGAGPSAAGSYYEYAAGAQVAGFMKDSGGALTDDYFIPGGLTTDTSSLLEGDFTTPGGFGGIADDISSLALSGGISTGDKFALVWFESGTNMGDKYGFFTHASWTIPSDGATEDYSTPFLGADPIRSANLTLQGVPEPSRAVLLLGGVLGLAMRRRRVA
ncbi:MAG: PEP-CTERM sorting domain-containing protein [Verrucomicrobiaceae bacterium]|nr:PEP-CTERM sorting domain-containing protein [Verrucomicrobiaceae bacterium]